MITCIRLRIPACATVKAIKIATSLPKFTPSCGIGFLCSPAICSQELTFSALFTRALDRFLFEDEHDGACLHQGPVCKKLVNPGNPEASDLYVMPFLSFRPGTPVMVSDLKLTEHDKALKETSLYARCCVHVRQN